MALAMHSPGVTKLSLSRHLSRTPLSNTEATHGYLQPARVGKVWKLGGNMALFCLPTRYTGTGTCGHFPEKGAGRVACVRIPPGEAHTTGKGPLC